MKNKREASTDYELTLGELSLYAAGQLSICYLLLARKIIDIETAIDLSGFDRDVLTRMHTRWIFSNGITAQRDLVRDMVISEAERQAGREEMGCGR